MKGRRLWFKIPCRGGFLRGYVQKQQVQDEEGTECDATYDPNTNEIFITWRPDRAWMEERALHEIFHAVSESATADAMTGILYGQSSSARHSHEERIVGYWSPLLYTVLAGARWLKLPKPPTLD